MSDEIVDAIVGPYLDRVTWEHRNPKFLAELRAILSGYAEIITLFNELPQAFDLDSALGAQLDIIGQWVGVSRWLETILENVWFSWDEPNVGWDAGLWHVPYQPTTGLYRLDDEHYRLLLKARIVANYWDGTIPGAYEAWNTLFGPEDYDIIIQDGMAAAAAVFTFDTDARQGWDSAAWQVHATPRVNYLRNSGLIGAKVGGAGIGAAAILPTYWGLRTGLALAILSIYDQTSTSRRPRRRVRHGHRGRGRCGRCRPIFRSRGSTERSAATRSS
jgi:hypothetical protein